MLLLQLSVLTLTTCGPTSNRYQMVSFSDKTDKTSPKIGYLPGQMTWFMQEALTKQGAQVLNNSEKGATHVDRELITGDSPAAANQLGVLAAPILVAFAAGGPSP